MGKVCSIILVFFSLVFFSACGGEGNSNFSQEKIDIDVSCVDNATIDDVNNYITLNSGDLIVQDEDNSEVKTLHSLDGLKKVCLSSGKAHIVRK